jgi:hypothetical protein
LAPHLGDILRANPTRTVFTATGVDWRVDANNPLAIFINGYVPLGSRPTALEAKNGLELYVNGSPVTPTFRGAAANGELTWAFLATLKGGSATTAYIAVDTAAGTIRFSQPPGGLMLTGSQDKVRQDPQVVADYIPGSLRLTTSELGAAGGVGFTTSTYETSYYWNTRYNHTNQKLSAPAAARADRLWTVWSRSGSATTLGPTLYYKAFRPGLQLITPLRGDTAAGNFYTFSFQDAPGQDPSVTSASLVLQDVDLQNGVLYFGQENEGRKVIVTASDTRGFSVTETHFIDWRQEGSEAPVPMDVAVNEGTVSAFPKLDTWSFVYPPTPGGAAQSLPHLNQIWVFWTSTRGSGSDIFQATIAPRMTPLPG